MKLQAAFTTFAGTLLMGSILVSAGWQADHDGTGVSDYCNRNGSKAGELHACFTASQDVFTKLANVEFNGISYGYDFVLLPLVGERAGLMARTKDYDLQVDLSGDRNGRGGSCIKIKVVGRDDQTHVYETITYCPGQGFVPFPSDIL